MMIFILYQVMVPTEIACLCFGVKAWIEGDKSIIDNTPLH